MINHRSLIYFFITYFVLRTHYMTWNFHKSLNHYIKHLNECKDN